jgi:hypothetical protein
MIIYVIDVCMGMLFSDICNGRMVVMNGITLNNKQIDECFGTTSTHIRNIPVYDCTTVKATGRHSRRRNSRVKLSYDIDRLLERMNENV